MNKVITLTFVSFLALASFAQASDSSHKLDKQEWSFEGPFGTFDRGELQRGFQVYSQVCSSCHSMKHLSYRNLSALGYTQDEIKAIAAEYEITDGPDDEGEMFERPRKPSDKFNNPYANDNLARYANNGSLPSDLSLITKARVGGANYVYGILTGYEEAPEGVNVSDSQHWNVVMPGNKIAMAAPLSDDIVSYEDGTPTTLAQYARDVSVFLTWAAEPEMAERKRTGIKVILFLLAFAGVMYAVKKKIWADVKH